MRRPLALLSHLGVVWGVWGTSYAAIAVSLEGLPPFALAGLRFVVAGVVLLALAAARGERPWRLDLARAMVPVGLWLIAVGDGALVWAARLLPSGQLSVLAATTPLWLLLAIWWREGERPRPASLAAIALGLLGALSVAGGGTGGGAHLADPGPRLRAFGVLAALGASGAWAWGSAAMRAFRPAPPLLAAVGWQLSWGGLALAVFGTARGEWGQMAASALLGPPLAAMLYLSLASCALGFVSYAWLLRHANAALAGSWAFVNPVVALWTGHLLLGEPLSGWVWIGTALVLAAAWLAHREPVAHGL